MAGDRSYRLSPRAVSDLEQIWFYTAQNWSMDQADAYVGALISAFDDLASGLRIGTILAINAKYRKLLVGSHAVFYLGEPDAIDIIRILHQSMDVLQHL